MSGGSLDYVYSRVDEVADAVLERSNTTPLQQAFGAHLKKVARALHDLEWVWSGDYGQGDDEESILKVLGDNATRDQLDILRDEANVLISQLTKLTKDL